MFNFYPSAKYRRPTKQLSLQSVYSILTGDDQKLLVTNYRNNPSKELKQKLPLVTFNAIFGQSKAKTSFIDFTGFIFCDIDKLSEEELNRQFNLLKELPFISLLWRSVSGKGLHFLVKVDTLQLYNDDEHFKARCKELSDTLGDTLDHKCFTINRNTFLSYDETTYLNVFSSSFCFKNKIELDTLTVNSVSTTTTSYIRGVIDTKCIKNFTDKERWNSNIVTQTQIDPSLFKGLPFVHVEQGLPFADVRYLGKQKLSQGRRSKTIYRMTSNAVYNSPNATRDDFIEFATNINNLHCVPSLPHREILEQVDKAIKNKEVPKTLKYTWFNNACTFTKGEKQDIANGQSALRKLRKSKNNINIAIQELKDNNQQITKTNLKQLTGMSMNTIKRHLPLETSDKKVTAINLIKEAITQLKEQGVSITNRSIHSFSKQSLQTIQKYRSIAEKELNESSVSTKCITSVSEKNEVYQESVPSVSYVSGDTLTLGQLVWAGGHTAWDDVAVTIKGELIETTSFEYEEEEPELLKELMSKYHPKDKLFVRGRYVAVDHNDDCSDLPI